MQCGLTCQLLQRPRVLRTLSHQRRRKVGWLRRMFDGEVCQKALDPRSKRRPGVCIPTDRKVSHSVTRRSVATADRHGMAGVDAFNHSAGHLQDGHGEHGAVHAIGRRLDLIDESTEEPSDVSEIGEAEIVQEPGHQGIHSIDPVRLRTATS